MAYWLATAASQRTTTWVKRFDPVYWEVNFPRPMMAAVTTTGIHSLRVDAVFYRKDDLAGLIWTSVDESDHPLLGYETNRDYRKCQLKFRWQSAGVMALDAINGPTLTIEGRDAAGVARSWYVRLWNYAVGSAEDAVISLDFGALIGGYFLPADGVPVWAGNIDRMFVSLVAPGYDKSDAPLVAPAEGWLSLSEIECKGSGSVLSLGDVIVPPHGLSIASGYDDSYNVTPARLLRNAQRLGYRGAINHYVGMSHYMRLEPSGAGYYASLTGGALNVGAAAWHRDFAARAKAMGFGLIVSLSYELLDRHCWNDWKQRAGNGDPALTGWDPPSVVLSPAHGGAMAYLQAIARAFVQIAVTAGQAPRFQIGEPWWWTLPGGRICLYDAAAVAAFAPVAIGDVRGVLTGGQKATLDAAGVLLAATTAALFAAVRTDHVAVERLMLVFLPTVLDPPEAARANVPVAWASPAFDVLQVEDYDWVTAGNSGASARGLANVTARLGYPLGKQHYLSGFARDASDWPLIADAAAVGLGRGVAANFLWALPQVLRDGFTYFDEGAHDMEAFDDVDFPLALGKDASVAPVFSTAVVTTASGYEQRNADWATARMSFDAGPGVRSEADVSTLIAFFRARRGAAKGFRFRDPFDFSSKGMTGVPGAFDQALGVGDGVRTSFGLAKTYGVGVDAEVRRVTRPVAVSVAVAVAGVAKVSGWVLAAGGMVVFDAAPAVGTLVTAGFRFDVPVRFAEDRLEVSAVRWLAGEVASVGLVEVRE